MGTASIRVPVSTWRYDRMWKKYAAAATLAVAVLVTSSGTASARESVVPPPDWVGVIRVAADYVESVQIAEIELAVYELSNQVGAYVADVIAVEAEAARIAAEQAAAREAESRAAAARPPAQPPTAAVQPSGGGSCFDGAVVPSYIIQRESGGNPSAVNPSSGAFGCYQFMPSTWSGSCSDLNPSSVADQHTCASRISNGGTNLQPWAL